MIERDNPELSVRRQCELLELSRCGIYTKQLEINPEDKKLLDLLDEIFLKFPYYGSRRLSKDLKRRGYKAGRTKVRRLMKKGCIEAIYPKKRLSIPGKGHKIYPYLLKGVNINRPNKVWAADITYIRMNRGFVYLVAIIDIFSRYILSWKISNTLDAGFCHEALSEAIESYGIPEYFNTDQGSQFTSEEFIDILKDHNIKISMDGKGRAIDNIFIERFWRTLKYEEVYLKSYSNITDCKSNLEEYFHTYNNLRLHQSLDYLIPEEVYYGSRKVG